MIISSTSFFNCKTMRSTPSISPTSLYNDSNITPRSMLRKQKKMASTLVSKLERAPMPSNPCTINAALGLLDSMFSFLSTSLVYLIQPPLHPSVDPNRVLTGNFAPVDELPPTDCQVVEGELPQCLKGTYIRNGPNPRHQPLGPHHLFEGDGMLHSIQLSDGGATFCSRYVKTYKYALEDTFGFPIFPNVLTGFYSVVDLGRCLVAIGRVIKGEIDPLKGFGLANTSLALFSNRLFALGESDLPYSIHLTEYGDIETIERCYFDGSKAFRNMTAHPKIDIETGEAFAFRCSPISPSLVFFRIDKNGSKQEDVAISSLKGPTYVHDFSITNRYMVFSESQLEMDLFKLITCRGMPASAKLDKVPRIGVLPKYASTDSEIKWFEAPGFNAMHLINAWEEGDEEIILIAPNAISIDNFFQNLEKVRFSLEKVRINLRNGSISRTILSENNLELGSINPSYAGKKNRYSYMGIGERIPKMSGVVKVDMELECEVSRRDYGSGCFGGEPLFVAKDGGVEEDDGYIVTYVHDENSGVSRFVVMDAKSQTLDVMASVQLPRRVPYGFHGLFVEKGATVDGDGARKYL